MDTLRRPVFWIVTLLLVVFTVLVLRPVPLVAESECEVVTGEVERIFEGGPADAVFVLAGVDKRYYINRGLEQGLDLDTLRRDLVGQEVTIKVPRYWTPLDPLSATRHVSKLEHGDTVLFDETR